MNSLTKFAVVAASGLLAQIGTVSADPAQTASTSACPSGMIAGPDGVCVKQKTGRMGFDLAAPSDDGAPAAADTTGNTRGIKAAHHHHKPS